ncbi:MAG: M48 family metallopeptidase [Planktomarina sp.]
MGFEDVTAQFFDGASARKKAVLVTLHMPTETVIIKDVDGCTLVSWPLDDMRQVKDIAGFGITVYLRDDPSAARLTISQPGAVARLEQAGRNSLNKSDVTGAMYRKVAFWAIAAASALALMIFVIVPALAAQLAGFIPPEREAQIGRAALRQIERLLSEDTTQSWFCDDAAGQAALDKMTTTLMGDEPSDYDIVVRAVDHEMFNAFALPGGEIILMRGLIDRADTAEQVAGVLAHELGHVANRDPMEHALRAAGTAGLLSLILGDATGGTVIALVTEAMLDANNSRKAESLADDYALAKLQGANVSPAGFAGFFEILMADHDDGVGVPAWASSHPPSQERADKARGLVEPSRSYSEILTDQEWAAVQNMCNG